MKRICMWAGCLLLLVSAVAAGERANIIVAQDGSGDVRTIGEALERVPANNARLFIILIRNGVYNEKVFITRNHVALVGENRDSTRIVFPVLRETWVKEHNSDWGAATVNIDSLAADITLANLTIRNPYGSLYHTDKHQFAVRGGGTRVIIINCTIAADGGDTLSLWNRTDGMYYHAFCSFEGYVDFVCPRGWCYITDSRFFGRNLSASIWHDGSTNKSQKFVIRSSYFDGVPGFPLGRNHRDGQIFLLDCLFSRAMADRPIYWPATAPQPWKWGDRHYYYNCHREGGDYAWFRDNLNSANGSPSAAAITPSWTFDGTWDPEESMPAVLPFVFLPRPYDGRYFVPRNGVVLAWTPARNADAQVVRFGTTEQPSGVLAAGPRSAAAGTLEPNTRYYWRVDTIVGTDTLRGPLWHFTTE